MKQKTYNFPGLVKEAKQLLKELHLPDVTNEDIAKHWSKKSWKDNVKNAVKTMCEEKLKKEIKRFKKLKDGPMPTEKFNKKEYMNSMTLSETRVKFKLRTHMFNVKWNYKSDPKYSRDLWRCDSCQSSIETQDHILWCPAYVDLRSGKDIKNDKDLINYMKNVLSIREKLNITKR